MKQQETCMVLQLSNHQDTRYRQDTWKKMENVVWRLVSLLLNLNSLINKTVRWRGFFSVCFYGFLWGPSFVNATPTLLSMSLNSLPVTLEIMPKFYWHSTNCPCDDVHSFSGSKAADILMHFSFKSRYLWNS